MFELFTLGFLLPGCCPLIPQEAGRSPGVREWKEGAEIRVRVPLATPEREVMSAVTLPETNLRAAITGWGADTLTAIQKGNVLFLRLSKKAEGHLSAIGESGTHYLLYLEGVDAKTEGGFDAFLKIVRAGSPQDTAGGQPATPKARPKPKGALELIRAMRLGGPQEGVRILRGTGETVYSSRDVELRLLYVYQSPSYIGRIYEVRNLSGRALALDASRFRAETEDLVLSALRENVIPPNGTTRLYSVFWRP